MGVSLVAVELGMGAPYWTVVWPVAAILFCVFLGALASGAIGALRELRESSLQQTGRLVWTVVLVGGLCFLGWNWSLLKQCDWSTLATALFSNGDAALSTAAAQAEANTRLAVETGAALAAKRGGGQEDVWTVLKWSLSTCFVLGLLVSRWVESHSVHTEGKQVKNGKSMHVVGKHVKILSFQRNALNFVMLNSFFAGTFMWFNFWLPRAESHIASLMTSLLQSRLNELSAFLAGLHLLATLNSADAALVSLAHALAFFVAGVLNLHRLSHLLKSKRAKNLTDVDIGVLALASSAAFWFADYVTSAYKLDWVINALVRVSIVAATPLVAGPLLDMFGVHIPAGQVLVEGFVQLSPALFGTEFLLLMSAGPDGTPLRVSVLNRLLKPEEPIRFPVAITEERVLTWAILPFVLAVTFGVYNWLASPEQQPFRGPKNVRAGVRPSKVPLAERIAAFPAPFPNGWFMIMASGDLKVGEVQEVRLCGTTLAAFRKESGEVSVMDGYCPHLGANFAQGGQVVGDCLQCPFHGWKFDGASGKCVEVPYAPRDTTIPDAAKVRVWPVREVMNGIWVYWDVEGKEPEWDIKIEQGVENGDFVFRGTWDMELPMHPQDFTENAADYAHFSYLHGGSPIQFLKRWLHMEHKVQWEAHKPPEAHVSHFTNDASLAWCGKRLEFTAMQAMVVLQGPGLLTFDFATPWGKIFIVDAFTPTEVMSLKNVKTWYSEPKVPRLLAAYVAKMYVEAFQDDEPVWRHKTYVMKPVLVRGDGPLNQLRAWYRQFYGKSEEAKKRYDKIVRTVTAAACHDW